MKEKDKSLAGYNRLFWILLVVCVTYLLLSKSATSVYLPYDVTDLQNFSDGWTLQDGTAVSLTQLKKVSTGEMKQIDLVATLPTDLKEGASLNFRSKNILFSIDVNGKEIYCFKPEGSLTAGRSYGSCFHNVQLSVADAGGRIVIHAFPIYQDNSCFFNMVGIGDSGAFYHEFILTHFLQFMTCVVIVLLGFVMIGFSYFVRKAEIVRFNLLSLGTFSIILGTWSAIETLVPQMVIGRVSFFHSINYLLLMLIPFPCMQFINSLMAVPSKLITKVMFGVSVMEIVVCGILNATGILDFHQSLPIIHTVLVISLIIFIVMGIRNKRYCRKNGITYSARPILNGFIVFGAFCVIDLYRYVFYDRASSDTGYFMRIGLFFYIMILFIYLLKRTMYYLEVANETEAIKRIAYMDVMTGLANRAAFLEKEKELQGAIEQKTISRVMVCQFDLNNLKYANDHFGHAFGDQYITTAATIIREVFQGYGTCYRIGGDEFATFLTTEPVEEVYQECIAGLHAAVERYNSREDCRMPFGIACGRAILEGNGETTIEKTETEADRDMYENKRRMKRENA